MVSNMTGYVFYLVLFYFRIGWLSVKVRVTLCSQTSQPQAGKGHSYIYRK